jgi:3'-5' exonuclease
MQQTIRELKNLVFLDIETVRSVKNWSDLSQGMQAMWLQKAARLAPEADPAIIFEQKAAIYAEFGRIAAIAIGYFHQKNEHSNELRVKSIVDTDEERLLATFAKILDKFSPATRFVAHNGREFDFPYLCRRFIVNHFSVPELLNMSGKKQWEIPHIDTMELWKFGDHKHYTSLQLLASLFELEPIDALESHEVSALYMEGKLERIAEFARSNAVLTAQLYLRLRNLPLFGKEQIVEV